MRGTRRQRARRKGRTKGETPPANGSGLSRIKKGDKKVYMQSAGAGKGLVARGASGLLRCEEGGVENSGRGLEGRRATGHQQRGADKHQLGGDLQSAGRKRYTETMLKERKSRNTSPRAARDGRTDILGTRSAKEKHDGSGEGVTAASPRQA